jgi:hypothetical protein
MANELYTTYKSAALQGDVDLVNDTISAVLVDTNDYTPDTTNHQFLDDIPAGARVASANLSNTSVSSGVFDADDVTFSNVSGDECEALVIYQDTGTASTSLLVAYIDNANGLPVTPNGGDITVEWDNGGNKIFAL